jgi:hypothetical protein
VAWLVWSQGIFPAQLLAGFGSQTEFSSTSEKRVSRFLSVLLIRGTRVAPAERILCHAGSLERGDRYDAEEDMVVVVVC